MGKLIHTVGGSSTRVSFRSAARVSIESLKVHFDPYQDASGVGGWTSVNVYHGSQYGSSANPRTITIDWEDSAGTVYGGYVDVISGEVWVEWKKVNLESLLWFQSEWAQYQYSDSLSGDIIVPDSASSYPDYLAENFYPIPEESLNPRVPQNVLAVTQSGQLKRSYHQGITDPTGYFIYRSQHPEIVGTVEPTALKTLLDQNEFWSDTGGTTEVSYAIHDSAMIRAAKRRIANFDATKKMNVPPNYREVEWIGAENASPYIRTGILSCVNLKANIVFYKDCNEAFLFGARNSTSNRQYNVNIMSSDPHRFRVDLGTGSGGDVRLNVPDTGGAGKFEIQIDLPNAIVTYADSSTYTVTTSSTNVYAGEYGDVLLFAVRTGNNISNGVKNGVLRIYSAKFWEFDELVRDFVPCIRKSDNIAGMYDKVTKQFFTSANSDTFSIPT